MAEPASPLIAFSDNVALLVERASAPAGLRAASTGAPV
jgi:hypothetical protein